jgi:6-pyruvoyltetrahydropterin/6-carboxytetrahydropterin synthase
MYRLFVESHFTAAHRLRGYEGHCGRLHGHTWKVRVEVESGRLDAIGISLDFKELKSLVDIPLEKLDHFHINEIPPFDAENPTAENLSRFIYLEVKNRLPEGVTVAAVTVWESEKYGVSYSEP